jgi:SAM-dependent methyltransferase
MSSIASKTLPAAASPQPANWLAELLACALPQEGRSIEAHGRTLIMREGILRAQEFVSTAQDQTKDTFGFKWAKRDTFEGEPLRFLGRWLVEKYGNVWTAPWLFATSSHPILLDAGCGAAMSALALFGPVLDRIRYLGVDVSPAVDVAKARFAERGYAAAFIQADLQQLPLAEESVDLIFSEGVLHHTDDTRVALARLVRHLKRGGRILFYVYRRKGPIREFTDDYVRDKMQAMTAEQAWAAMMPLTRLGKALGDLDITVDVPERIDLLDIPVGPINLQRLFYWHVFKAFYQPQMTLDEMNHINFDWYAPKNAHRHTIEEVRGWCGDLELAIEREKVEDAGLTIIARRN